MWLFTNMTLSPELIVTDAGLTAPFAPIVIVAPIGPGLPPPPPGFGEGPVVPPPQAIASDNTDATAMCFEICLVLTTLSPP